MIPSGYTPLDYVGFTDKDTYSPSENYVRNDLVHYGGNIWKCLIDNTTDITPVEGANWTLWVGASANLAERTIAPLENNPADTPYGVRRQIIYDDWMWEVIKPIAIGDSLIDYAVDPINGNIKKSAPVETQLLAVKAEADATDDMIAPTETDATSSSAAYAVGDQLILNNVLYDVTAAIAIGDALATSGAGANIAVSRSLTAKIKDAYVTGDAAETTLDDADYVPFYDTSATAKKKTLWSNIKSVLGKLFTHKTDIAPTEVGASILHQYSAGDQFYYEGTLYTALQTIAANTAWSSLTPNTDYKASDDVSSQIQALANNAKPYKFSCGVVIGNSYASGTGASDNHGIFYHLKNELLEDGKLYSGSGTGFVDYDGSHTNDTFLTHLNDAINDATLDKNNVDVIFIIGAYGDSRTYIANSRNMDQTRSAMASEISTFVTNAYAAFPKLKAIYYVNAESRAVNKKVTGDFTSYIDDTFMINEVIAPLLDDNHIINLGWSGLPIIYNTDYFSSDSYHPNSDGYKKISDNIINKVQGGLSNYYFFEDIVLDVSAFTGTANSTLSGRVIISESNCEFDIANMVVGKGTVNISSSYVAIDLATEHINPFQKSKRNLGKATLCQVGNDVVIINVRPQVNNTHMCLEIRSATALTATYTSNQAVNFDTFI